MPPASSCATTSTSSSRPRRSSAARAGSAGASGRGRTGVVTVSTGEGSLIADLAPRLGLDLPPIPARDAGADHARPCRRSATSSNPLDPWGAGEGAPTYRAVFDAFVDSGAYDVLALVHDFPFRSQRERGRPRRGARARSSSPRPRTGPRSCRSSSRSRPATSRPRSRRRWTRPAASRSCAGTATAFGAIAAARVRGSGGTPSASSAGPSGRAGPSSRRGRPARALDSSQDAAAAARPAHRCHRSSSRSANRSSCSARPACRWSSRSRSRASMRAAMLPSRRPPPRNALGWPVAVKLDAPGLAHKTDVGGVELGIAGRKALAAALRRLVAAGREHDAGWRPRPADGARRGVELIVGRAARSRSSARSCSSGIGGVLAEVLDDVVAPPRADHARRRPGDARRAPRRAAPRRPARPPGRRPDGASSACSSRSATPSSAHPEWREVDLNPVVRQPAPAPSRSMP